MGKRRLSLIVVPAIFVAVLIACENDEKYEFINDCSESEVDAGCESGTAYTCPGASLPSDTDPTIVCETAMPGQNGETIFCCNSSSSSTCNADSTVTCASGATGFYCSGADSPTQTDPSLECTSSANASGGYDYCCVHEAATAGCTQDLDAGGCAGGGTTYDCPIDTSPQTSNPSLSCGLPTLLSNGLSSYCCTTH